jgi:hypothetical protein
MKFSRLSTRRIAASLLTPALVAASLFTAVPALALDPGLPPSQNFDLTHFKLTIPSGVDILTDVLNNDYTLPSVFYTDLHTGGMVFESKNIAGHTQNSHYARSELREMLDPNGDTDTDANNWTTAQGGIMRARLRVDHVSTTGDSAKYGRVVIGQIHGPDTEVIRLYYTKLPGEATGRIYAGMDDLNDNNTYSPDIVSNKNDAGIALGQPFNYAISLTGTKLHVHIRTSPTQVYDYYKRIDPGYKGLHLYFKAGVYNQNDTGDKADYCQATFFSLTHTH